jgi:hypothetical protein
MQESQCTFKIYVGFWKPEKGLNLLTIFMCAVCRSGSMNALYIG